MNATFAGDLPKGIQKITALPDPGLAELWDSIIVEAEMKEHLLSQAVLGTVASTVAPANSRGLTAGQFEKLLQTRSPRTLMWH